MFTRKPRIFAAALLSAAMLASGCEVNVEAGRRPDLAALERSLVLGQSTKDDVRRAFGEPFGTGRAMYPFHDSPRDAWAYYHERGSMEDDRRTFLWIFFDRGLYDGHIWFSSLPDP